MFYTVLTEGGKEGGSRQNCPCILLSISHEYKRLLLTLPDSNGKRMDLPNQQLHATYLRLLYHRRASIISGSHPPSCYQGAQSCHSMSYCQPWLMENSHHGAFQPCCVPSTSAFLIILANGLSSGSSHRAQGAGAFSGFP